MKRPVPAWVWGMAIILAPSLLFLGLAVGGARMTRENRFKEVTPQDRAHLVTAADLGHEVDARREVLLKTEESNGSVRLTYRYPEELMPGDPVSVECLVVRLLDATAAKKALDDVEAEVRKSLDRKDVLAWGDESRAGLLLRKGQAVGVFYAARKDRFLFVLRVTGAQPTPEQLEAVMRPKLEQLHHFKP